MDEQHKTLQKRRQEIAEYRSDIAELKDKIEKLHKNMRHKQDMLYLAEIERMNKDGFVDGVKVLYVPCNTEHVLDGKYMDRDTDEVAVVLNPPVMENDWSYSKIYAKEIILKEPKN